MRKWGIALAIIGLVGSFTLAEDASASSSMPLKNLDTQKAETVKASPYITANEAKELALAKLGGKVVDIEFEREGRHVFYEMELLTTTEEIDVEVNAVTGEVVVTERERLCGAKSNEKAPSVINKQEKPAKTVEQKVVKSDKKPLKVNVTASITKEQAIETALERVGKRAIVTNVEREGVYYEIELKHGKFEYEVKIHAKTGKVVKYKVERD